MKGGKEHRVALLPGKNLALKVADAQRGGERRVGAQLHQRAHVDLGKSGAATTSFGFGDARAMLGGVAHTPARAVDAHEAQPGEETTGMQLRVGQRAQRLLHDEQEDARAEARAALAEGRVTDVHAETLAHALREATGKRQRVSHQRDDELPALNLTPQTLMRTLINLLKNPLIPTQQRNDAADKIV